METLAAVVEKLKHQQIIPGVIPNSSFNPTLLLSIVYPGGKEVSLGNNFTVEETQDEPSINFTPLNMPVDQANSSEELSYTLAMVDPDAPSRTEPLYKSFRHWLVTGLKYPRDSASKTSDLTALKTRPVTTPYRPPGPRPGSGMHRYIFLLFQEPSALIPFSVPEGSPEYGAALEERRSWDAVKFANQYGLKLVGVNYMLVHSSE